MKYHILGEHPERGRLLTGFWYSLPACRRNHKRLMEQAEPGRTWKIVRCLTDSAGPDGGHCDCELGDTFQVEE